MTPSDVPADVTNRAAAEGLHVAPLPHTIDRDRYSPALLGLLNNVLVWGGSRVFSRRQAVGTNEWRIVSALANRPGSTAGELCDVLGMNKSIASKSINALLDRAAIAQLDGRRGARHLYLTDAGAAVHDDLLPVALERESILHSGLSEAEVAQLQSLLLRMLDASPALLEFDRQLLDGGDFVRSS